MITQRLERLLVESEDGPFALHHDWPFDQVRVTDHQVDRLALGLGQRPLFEHRAAAADEVEEGVLVHVAFEERA